MQLTQTIAFLALAVSASADLHWAAACVDGRTSSPIGGTPFSVSYNWAKNFIMNPGATQCACNHYRNRNTGGKHWDRCPDCTFDGVTCRSAAKHIGGDEMNYYCSRLCGAQGSEAD
ncbi:hypothetical protein BS50DRAFT_662233 [Corynespora cassiicola Philippines]|uniref:Uncharacterized protein n=1 Tax=Corynespora cassiicola Philippines TaxID=1448308 RepID=A0A2T2NXN9_CORCC|nr:hypothetical protein BS50DRAFT_662233 [Corynespora cassiicola Philippines]